MSLQILDPTQYPNWDEFLISTPGNTFFHTSAWAKVLKEAYGYTPKYFTEFDRGQMSILIPIMEVQSFLIGNRAVSLPFADYCDPIVDRNTQFQDLFFDIVKYGKKSGWKSLELRSGNDLLLSAMPSLTYLGHILNLSLSEKEIFSNFRDSTRRNAKKAIREGLEAKIYHSLESVKEFYRLNSITRKQHGLPPQPFNFFKKIYDHIIAKDLGLVILASINEENIAGAIYFHFGEKVFYKYGASDLQYQHFRANNLVMWEAIKWYSQNEYKSLCFGRTESENQGLIQFKSGWGAKEQNINYYRYNLKKETFISAPSRVSGFHNKIFRSMPIPLLKKVGSILYKYAG